MTAAFRNPDDDSLRRLLEKAHRIVIVGLSPKPHRDSHRVALYLQERGYEIVPVYPREERILGEKVHRSVRDVTGAIDVVDVFRRREEIPNVVEDVLASSAKALWLQLGCVDERAALQASERGLEVVMDRCLMVDHARLLGRGRRAS